MAELCFSVTLLRGGAVTTAVDTPRGVEPGRTPVLVLAHGAGSDLRSEFLEYFAAALSERGLCVVRFNFPYTEQGGRRPPDRMDVLVDTYREVVAAQAKRTGSPRGPLFVGGKSMGGRAASVMVAQGLVRPSGLVFLGYPLHPAGKKDELRSEHLAKVKRPMLFVQGSRDPLCDLELLRSERQRLALAGSLHVIEGGGHSLELPRSEAARQAREREGAADTMATFVRKVLGR